MKHHRKAGPSCLNCLELLRTQAGAFSQAVWFRPHHHLCCPFLGISPLLGRAESTRSSYTYTEPSIHIHRHRGTDTGTHTQAQAQETGARLGKPPRSDSTIGKWLRAACQWRGSGACGDAQKAVTGRSKTTRSCCCCCCCCLLVLVLQEQGVETRQTWSFVCVMYLGSASAVLSVTVRTVATLSPSCHIRDAISEYGLAGDLGSSSTLDLLGVKICV